MHKFTVSLVGTSSFPSKPLIGPLDGCLRIEPYQVAYVSEVKNKQTIIYLFI